MPSYTQAMHNSGLSHRASTTSLRLQLGDPWCIETATNRQARTAPKNERATAPCLFLLDALPPPQTFQYTAAQGTPEQDSTEQ